MIEPIATAAIIALFGVLLAVSALMTGTLNKLGVPVVLLFLGLGMLAGSEGVGGLAFDNADFAFRIGTIALVLILLDGGLNTRWSSIRSVAAPAGLLATVGVAGTAAVVALAGRLLRPVLRRRSVPHRSDAGRVTVPNQVYLGTVGPAPTHRGRSHRAGPTGRR